MSSMKRVWHPYWLWEDCAAGMWNPLSGKAKSEGIQKAIAFTGDANLYGLWMLRVIEEWPIACEHNLTEKSMNRLAWIGHAAACMAIQVPEEVTRMAWGQLTQEQRARADARAQRALDIWIKRHEGKNQAMDSQMGIEGVR